MKRAIVASFFILLISCVVPVFGFDLSEATDTTLSFTTGGHADWFSQSAVSYFDSDAAQSGVISHNQQSWMETVLSGPTTLSFYWKVSSEWYLDNLKFYIDGQLQDEISGSMDWQQKAYDLGQGSHELKWQYSKDYSVNGGNDCGWVDKIEWSEGGSEPPSGPPAGDLSDAIDTTFGVNTGGDTVWFAQSTIFYYDSDAAQSGAITNNQDSWMRTTVDGDTTVSFYWKVSSESRYDFLEFYIDGECQERISGEVGWEQEAYALGSGSHTLEWKYVKDGSVNSGDDCGWVDQLEFESGGGSEPPPDPGGDLSEAIDTTFSVNTGGDEDWFAQSTIFYYDSDAAQSGAITNNRESWMRTTVDGDTTISFYWKVSSESRYDFLEFYMDGERQERISGQVDWIQRTYALSSGSHTLEWRYIKDGSVNSGSDCGWVDRLEFGSGGGSEPPPEPPEEVELSDALDTTLAFTSGGSQEWFGQSGVFYYDSDAAQSGDISHSQESWMQTMVNGEGTVSFYWKVSSELSVDYLQFYIDGEFEDQISGSVDWQHKQYALDDGVHTLKWRYVKDYSVNGGSDCGWVDQLEWDGGGGSSPPAGDLSDALDTAYSFNTGGNANWLAQSTVSFYDGDAAKSGNIADNQISWMQTSVGEVGMVSFYWKVSSENNYDFLEFYIDGEFEDRISGSVDWQSKQYELSSGSHTLEWRYTKDGSRSIGSDCAWVDYVRFTGGSEPPPDPPSDDLSEALDTTYSFDTGGNADWFEQSTTFIHDGDAGESGNIVDNQESWMRTIVAGPTPISFYWKVSSEAFFDFLEFYIDGIFRNQINGFVDWQQMTYTLGQGSHELKWRYYKDGSMSSGNDCGWVDKLELSSGSEPPDPNEPDPNEPEPPTPSDDLSEALDTDMILITEGDAEWFNQFTRYYFDSDAAQSGNISHRQESRMETEVDGAGTVSFYWKVSSEGDYDYLSFYVDGELQDAISGEVDWQRKIYSYGSGAHTLQWRYAKDRSMSYNGDCGWVDKLEWEGGGGSEPPAQDDLSQALDTNLLFTTGGDEDWFAQNTTYFYGEDAAQSGDIFLSQESWMRTSIFGPNTVSFYWKVSSEESADFLEFYIDGALQDSISGSVDWQQKTYDIGYGTYSLKWRYVKDATTSAGADCGWVDKIDYSGGSEPPPPPPQGDLAGALDTDLSIDTGGQASWFAQSVMFYNDGDAVQSGDILDSQESWMQTTVDGPSTVSFYWKVSSEGGYDYLAFYIDDEIQDLISGAVGWQQMAYGLAEGSHTLEWRYTKDQGVSLGGDCGWVDQLEVDVGGSGPPSSDLSEVLDSTLTFESGGSEPWFGQFSTYYYDSDAAQSGTIWHYQESFLRTTVSGPTNLSFYWKVSSETNYDFLGFDIDGALQDRISGLRDWQLYQHTIPSGVHTLNWRYIKDGSASEGYDCGWVDKVELGDEPEEPPGEEVELSEAMDTTLTFTTGGNAGWFGQTETSYFDGDAAQSGDILDNGSSWLRTTRSGGVNLSFFWKISSEVGFDFLEFYIDGQFRDRISGERGWQQRIYPLPEGWQTYTLEWRYIKDGSRSDGGDCGWVDLIE